MATKNNPGKFDCYANADPDEPMFVLLGRDPDAPKLVEEWAKVRENRDYNPEKVAEARQCATAMRGWLKKIGRTETTDEWPTQTMFHLAAAWRESAGSVRRNIEQTMLDITQEYDEHPEGWDMPCFCYECRSN